MKKQNTGVNMQINTSGKRSSEGYRKLAAAIIASGVRENDQTFLNGEWCETLQYFIKLGQQQGSGDLSGMQSYTKYI